MRPTLTLILLLCGACSQLPGTSTLTALDPSVVDRLPVMMKAYGVEGMTVVAVSGQEILLSEAYGTTKTGEPFTTDTSCPIYSATKVLTSLTIASLVEGNEFDVNSTLSEHLNDAPDDWLNIPFWRLLNHSSGITMIVNKPVFSELVEDPRSSNEDVYKFVRNLPLDYKPGEFSRYRQSGYGIAEMILTDKFNAEWPTLIAKHVTKPANASQTVYTDMLEGRRNTPLLSSAGGYHTTSNDMAKIFKTLNRGEIVSPEFLEELLYETSYNFNGYSLGSVLADVDGVRTVGHSGGGRANLRFAPAKGVGIMVCTDDTSNNNIMHGVANMLMREIAVGESTLMPAQTLLHEHHGQTAKKIISSYEDAKSTSPQTYDFSDVENTLNMIGYRMLSNDRATEAIDIFRLNTREHPKSANAYDSLGEALLAAKNPVEALQNYKKVLDLDPGNKNATMMIDKIESGPLE